MDFEIVHDSVKAVSAVDVSHRSQLASTFKVELEHWLDGEIIGLGTAEVSISGDGCWKAGDAVIDQVLATVECDSEGLENNGRKLSYWLGSPQHFEKPQERTATVDWIDG